MRKLQMACTGGVAIALLLALAAPAAARETGTDGSTTTAGLLAGMVTEEVEPGVLRVVNDGVRDLSSADNDALVAGHDGGMWLLRHKRFMRVGSGPAHEWPANSPVRRQQRWEWIAFEVAPDGTVWIIDRKVRDDRKRVNRIRSYDGAAWTTRHRVTTIATPYPDLEIAADDTVLAMWGDPDARPREHPKVAIVARLGADGWVRLGRPVPVDPRRALVATGDDVWVGHRRYVDGAWQAEEVPEVSDDETYRYDIGADGLTFLVRRPTGYSLTEAATWDGRHVVPPAWELVTTRFDGTEWRTLGPSLSLPGDCWDCDVDLMGGPDGSHWVTVGGHTAYGSLVHLDGVTWRPFLTGHHIVSSAFDADGSLWVLALDPGDEEPFAAADDRRHVDVVAREAVPPAE